MTMNCPNCNTEMELSMSYHICQNKNCAWWNISFTPKGFEAVRNTIAAARTDNPWKSALTNAAVVSWTLTATNKDDPAQMLADLLAQAQREALDPQISEGAAKLVEVAQDDGYKKGQEDLFSWFDRWEPLVNPTVGGLEQGVADAVADARRYFGRSPAPEPAPACPVCGEPMKRGSTWLCIKDKVAV